MTRTLVILMLTVVLSSVVVGATTSASLLPLTAEDFVEAWTATEQDTDGMECVIAYPGALHGRAAARRDVAMGRLSLKTWGLPAPWRSRYLELLEARGVSSVIVAGCVVSHPQLASWKGYNDVMRAEIGRRYGDRFLRDTAVQAELEFRAADAGRKI